MKNYLKRTLWPICLTLAIVLLTFSTSGFSASPPLEVSSSPVNVRVTDKDNESITIKYDAPLKDGGTPIIKYIIEYRIDKGGDWKKKGTTTGKSFIVDGLTEGETYSIHVIAVNAVGPSLPSDTVTEKVTDSWFW